jgi:hypothetical protein
MVRLRRVAVAALAAVATASVAQAQQAWPAKHFYVARGHFLGSAYVNTSLKIHPKILYF